MTEGVDMKLLSFDEGNKKFDTEFYTNASIIISSNNRIVYKRYKDDIINPSVTDFNFLFAYLNEGDSAQFKIELETLIKNFSTISLNEIKTKEVVITIKIHNYYTEQEFETLNSSSDAEMTEQLLLTKYLKENGINNFFLKRGVYIQQISEGEGEKIASGKVISIHYKGYFINRIEFDNTYKELAFTYTYGSPDQVIKGLEIAINGMKKGEKSKIIIPSQLAFGEEGSSTQIVPPFTTVIYELEIVNVK